jgi:hypothetical protein
VAADEEEGGGAEAGGGGDRGCGLGWDWERDCSPMEEEESLTFSAAGWDGNGWGGVFAVFWTSLAVLQSAHSTVECVGGLINLDVPIFYPAFKKWIFLQYNKDSTIV